MEDYTPYGTLTHDGPIAAQPVAVQCRPSTGAIPKPSCTWSNGGQALHRAILDFFQSLKSSALSGSTTTIEQTTDRTAALEGSLDKALAAFTTDPLTGSGDSARPLLEELITASTDRLPKF